MCTCPEMLGMIVTRENFVIFMLLSFIYLFYMEETQKFQKHMVINQVFVLVIMMAKLIWIL